MLREPEVRSSSRYALKGPHIGSTRIRYPYRHASSDDQKGEPCSISLCPLHPSHSEQPLCVCPALGLGRGWRWKADHISTLQARIVSNSCSLIGSRLFIMAMWCPRCYHGRTHRPDAKAEPDLDRRHGVYFQQGPLVTFQLRTTFKHHRAGCARYVLP